MGRPLSLLWSWSGALKVSWRIWVERLDPGSAGRALGHDEDPDGLDRTVSALGRSLGPARENGPGGLDGVEGVGLAAVASGLAVLTVHLDDLDPGSSEEPGDAGPIGTGPLYADLARLPRRLRAS